MRPFDDVLLPAYHIDLAALGDNPGNTLDLQLGFQPLGDDDEEGHMP